MKQIKIYTLRTLIVWLKGNTSYYKGSLQSWIDNAFEAGFLEFQDKYLVTSYLVLLFDCECVLTDFLPLEANIQLLESKISEL